MEEIWRDIPHFEGYQVSNHGRVRTFWTKKHYPTGYGCYCYINDTPRIMHGSDDGNGYLKVMLYCHEDGLRYCKKIHRLVAEVFIDHKPEDDTVDHIKSGPDGKLDNSINNLRWIPRSENIKKAYRDGVCDARINQQRVPIVVFDDWTGLQRYYHSITDASIDLGVDQSSISHSIGKNRKVYKRYYFEYADREDILLHGNEDYQFIPWV